MSTKPPQEVVDADYKVIHDGHIKQWVGIGWVTERKAKKSDYKHIPEIVD